MEINDLYPILGIISAVLLVLSMSRGLVGLLLPAVVKDNRAKGKKSSFIERHLIILTKNHGLFGMAAVVFAVIHGTLMFIENQLPSLTGGSLIVFLLAQGTLGILQTKKIGNVKLWNRLHTTLPYMMIVLLALHIIFNSNAGL